MKSHTPTPDELLINIAQLLRVYEAINITNEAKQHLGVPGSINLGLQVRIARKIAANKNMYNENYNPS